MQIWGYILESWYWYCLKYGAMMCSMCECCVLFLTESLDWRQQTYVTSNESFHWKTSQGQQDFRRLLLLKHITDIICHSLPTWLCLWHSFLVHLVVIIFFIHTRWYAMCGYIVYCLFVCNIVRLRISPARIKLEASNFARWFRGVLGRESPISGIFAPAEAQNQINRPTLSGRRIGMCG